ncbi:MAG: LptA/OstA family protein [Pseudomonadota bacterium]
MHRRIGKLFSSALIIWTLMAGSVMAQTFGGAFDGVGDNDEPIQIEADSLEVIDDQNTALLSGNVSVVQGTTILKAKAIKVYYFRKGQQNQSKSGIRLIEATGKVAVRSEDNFASADKAIVDMASEIVTMSGNVYISQGNNVVNGCKLIVNLQTNVSEIKPCAEASGKKRIKMLLDPKSRNNN